MTQTFENNGYWRPDFSRMHATRRATRHLSYVMKDSISEGYYPVVQWAESRRKLHIADRSLEKDWTRFTLHDVVYSCEYYGVHIAHALLTALVGITMVGQDNRLLWDKARVSAEFHSLRLDFNQQTKDVDNEVLSFGSAYFPLSFKNSAFALLHEDADFHFSVVHQLYMDGFTKGPDEYALFY